MKNIFGGFKFILVYLDDIIIHSKSFKEHLTHIKQVINLLRENNLKGNWTKCKWAEEQLNILF